jgi:hypothetical protein
MPFLPDYLKQQRPNLSDNSIRTYTSTLLTLYRKAFGDKPMTLTDFEDSKRILEVLKDIPPNRRKSILSALTVLTNMDDYRTLMRKDITSYEDDIAKQEKTDSQKASWVTQDEVQHTFQKLQQDASVLFKKPNKTPADLQAIQNYFIMMLYSQLPVRRSLDYCMFRIRGDFDKKVYNHLDKNKLVFVTYKGSEKKGKQTLDCPKPVMAVLKKWIAINPTECLLFDTKGHALTPVTLNQRLNRIFGKKASINALRHSFLTEKYADVMRANKDMDKTMHEMGSSSRQAETYVKLD